MLALLLAPVGVAAQVSFTVGSFTPDIYGLGTATLTWSASSASVVQIRVFSSDGPLLAEAGNAGSGKTGDWCTDGMQFYLQDISLGVPGVTIATVTAHAGPPATLVGAPNPFMPDSEGLGLITLSWSVGPDVTAVEIRVNSATGPSLTGVTNSLFAVTGEWVTDGMQFYLQNVTYGEPGSTLRVFAANQALPTPHSVSLSWTASTSSDVAGYNVFRGFTPGGPYTIVSSSLVPGTTFADNAVQAGQTYYYVCAAVDTSNNQSTYSSEVEATVPSP
jgi:hypothetical protein